MKRIYLNTLIMGCLFLSGCATSSDSVMSATSTEDGYMYNRSNNLEYMNVKNIEKVKRAVSLLIDKVDALDARTNQKLDKGSLDNDLLLMKKDIEQIKESPASTESTNVKPKVFSTDDEKILDYIKQEENNGI